MAPADAGDFLLDEDDDDFFSEYNPHPYRGGYDLAATFGTPLPPSANTCYPVSSSTAATVPNVPSPPSPTPEAADPPPEEPYGDQEASRELVHESPEVFRNGSATKGKGRRGGWCGRGFWRKCVRGLDYVFGYKDPYVEQPIGVNSYVVPVYANRKESGEDALALAVEVEVPPPPPSVGRVEPHDGSEELVQSNDLSWHSNYKDDADTYSQSMSNSYYTPYFAQSHGLPEVFGKPDWFPNFSYSESHRIEDFQHEALLSYDVEHLISGQPVHCYHHHCYKQPLDVQVGSPEPVSSQKLEYYEHFSTYGQSDGHILETPAYAYNIQSYMPISDMPIEPFNPSWSQNWSLSDAYTQGDALENDAHSLISGEYGAVGSLFISPFYPRETETFEWGPSDEHASFQHNWHNLSYQNVSMDGVSLISQHVRKKVVANING
ncbi:uncharacterized protein C2845_PM01G13910 [Panicum miliaceum]|uniref:Uncharacterized protein n=1 Tax=Panicum miliaceum TaxID=4540 RepID=A0A3L6TTI2_PANMI|nr:uncharacterized protein C2845_PM01G13910 [Panicum miliaceum]